MQPTRFGTVRPRVQIPGPRPTFELGLLKLHPEFGSNSRASGFCPVREGGFLISNGHLTAALHVVVRTTRRLPLSASAAAFTRSTVKLSISALIARVGFAFA